MNTSIQYVYVASSWRNPHHAGVCAALAAAGIDHYDFKNPEGGTGFSWRQVRPDTEAIASVSAPPVGMKAVCANCNASIEFNSFVGMGLWEPDIDQSSYVARWRHKDGYSACNGLGGTFAAPTGVKPKGSDWERAEDYLAMVNHPVAITGFESDFGAMQRADAFVLVLPCGKSAHLELGWAAGAGKRTAILLEDPVEPELMYRMVDLMTTSVDEIVAWLGGDSATSGYPGGAS